MLKKEEIEQFYKDVLEVDLKFPVAAIAQATGHSKANVSKYLSRKLEPSEAFLRVFYEKFPKNGKIVAPVRPQEAQGSPDYRDDIISLLKEKLNLSERRTLQLLQRNHALLKAVTETLPILVSRLEKIKLLEATEEMGKRIEHHLDALKKESI